MEIACRMRSGMTSVNSVIAFASDPELPFGGVGDSGFGRIHGEDGLREFARREGDHPAAVRAPRAAHVFPQAGRRYGCASSRDQGAARSLSRS